MGLADRFESVDTTSVALPAFQLASRDYLARGMALTEPA